MKNLSYWALMNPWKSQTLLVLCQLSLAVLAIYSGVWLFAHDVLVPKFFLYAGETLFIVILIVYPIRRARHKFWKTNFVRRKIMDAGFVFSYWMIAITISNTDANLAWNDASDAPFTAQIAMRENTKPTVSADYQAPLLSRKALRQQFKTFVSGMKERVKTDGSGKRLKIGGIVFLMILGLFLVAGLSCSLACSNANGGATLLLIGGTVLVLALGIAAIRKIAGKKKGNYQPTPTPPNEKI